MPSRSNPNTPSKHKRKTAGALKSHRHATQRRLSATHPLATNNRVTKPTSQALRRKAARERREKVEAKAKKGVREREREGRMDVDVGEKEGKDGEKGKKRKKGKEEGEGKAEMELDR